MTWDEMTLDDMRWDEMLWDRFIGGIEISKRWRGWEDESRWEGGGGEELKNINSCNSCRNDNRESTPISVWPFPFHDKMIWYYMTWFHSHSSILLIVLILFGGFRSVSRRSRKIILNNNRKEIQIWKKLFWSSFFFHFFKFLFPNFDSQFYWFCPTEGFHCSIRT